jgi:hypothetical protein
VHDIHPAHYSHDKVVAASTAEVPHQRMRLPHASGAATSTAGAPRRSPCKQSMCASWAVLPPPPQGRLAAGDRTPYRCSAATPRDHAAACPLASLIATPRHRAPRRCQAPRRPHFSSKQEVDFAQAHVASVCFKCFRCFTCML